MKAVYEDTDFGLYRYTKKTVILPVRTMYSSYINTSIFLLLLCISKIIISYSNDKLTLCQYTMEF